jgi:hypothetical protein
MMRRRRLVSGLAAVAAASLASGQTPARPNRAATMSRERPDRIVICPLPRRGVLIAAGTAMPLHHPAGTVGRARATQRCWAGGVEELKKPWRDCATHLVMSPLEFMQRLSVLVPRGPAAPVNDCFAAANLDCWMPGVGRLRPVRCQMQRTASQRKAAIAARMAAASR